MFIMTEICAVYGLVIFGMKAQHLLVKEKS